MGSTARWRRVMGVASALLAMAGCEKKQEAGPPPPPSVLVTEVVRQDVPLTSEWIGTLDGFVNAQIRAQVSGYLLQQSYREGSRVNKGDLLFEIDPRPFQAVLDQAKAQLGKTELDVNRLIPLAKQDAVSRQELDDAVQANLANKAAVEAAQLNLNFTRIASPVDGIAGIATAQVGDLVGPSTGDLTTVSTVDPIKVYFTISEQEYLNCPSRFLNETESNVGDTGRILEMILTNGSVYPHKGKVYVADRQVDARTGTLRIAGLFPNPGEMLRPGQYARVRTVTEVRQGALLVPQRAVTELQGSYQVTVVDPNDQARIRSVAVGPRVGPMWIIEKGVKAGERVVVEGIQKAQAGATVRPEPYVPATPDPARR